MALNPIKDRNGTRGTGAFDSSRAFRSGSFGSSISGRNKIFMIAGLGVLWTTLLATVGIRALSSTAESDVPAASSSVMEVVRTEQPEMMQVLVPVQDIEADRPLSAEMFIRVSKPKAGLSQNAITSYDEIRGTYARSFIPARQPIVREAITGEKPSNAVIASIPEGHRAVTISVNVTSGVEGWARAGAYVDVHWIADIIGTKATRLLVQNAKIVSAERNLDPKGSPDVPVPTTVTLIVADRDAQKISLATTAGQIVLHLRGAADRKSGNNSTLTLSDLLVKSDGADGEKVKPVAWVKLPDGSKQRFVEVDGRVLVEGATE